MKKFLTFRLFFITFASIITRKLRNLYEKAYLLNADNDGCRNHITGTDHIATVARG